MPLPNNPSNRRPTGRIGARGPASRPPSVRAAAPPRPQGQDPLEDDERGVAGRRGAPEPNPQDKKVIKYGLIGGVVIVVIGVAIGIATKKAPEPPPKEAPKAVTSTGWPSADTPEGRAEIEKMFNSGVTTKISKYIDTIGPETATKIKDTLIRHLLAQDVHSGLTEAHSIALKLAGLKDPRILNRIIDFTKEAKDKDYVADLLKTYGAMGSQAVIDRATADKPETMDAYFLMLTKCQPADANGPMVTAAETSDKELVAWICGDALYQRDVPIKLERVQAWLAGANTRARASGIRQMAIQKGTDRDTALAPFSAPEASVEERMAVLDVLTTHHDLSTDHMKRLLSTDDQGVFSDIMDKVHGMRLIEYIPVLEEMNTSGMSWKTRRVGSTLEALKNIARNKR